MLSLRVGRARRAPRAAAGAARETESNWGVERDRRLASKAQAFPQTGVERSRRWRPCLGVHSVGFQCYVQDDSG